jgi:hypothetical protein
MARKPPDPNRPQFIRNTYGDWVGTLINRFIWDLRRTCVAWVDEDGEVWKIDGEWIGTLSPDGRIVRRRSDRHRPFRQSMPAVPPIPDLPGRAPLPPAFRELTFSEVDVLEEYPDIFKRISDVRPDME